MGFFPQSRSSTRKKAPRKQRPKGQSNREREFIYKWITLAGPRLTPQYPFHPGRRWRFDWAHPESRVAIEIHGGIFMFKGRHTTGNGFWGDRIKMNSAQRLNWKVFELTSNDLDDERVYRELIDEIERRMREGVPDRQGVEAFKDVYPNRKNRKNAA